MNLDDALRMTLGGDGGRIDASVAESWCIHGRAHGGYLAALAERACAVALARPDATLRAITVHYLRGVSAGAVEFDVTVEHSGRRLATVSFRMRQGDAPAIVGVASFAPPGEHEGVEFREPTPMPQYPPVETLVRSLDVPYVPAAFLELLDVRLAPDPPLFSSSEAARVGGWVRLAQRRRPDVSLLLVLCDVFPRALMATQSQSPRVPPPTTSLHMLIHESDVAARVRDDEHLIAQLTTRRVNEGFFDEDSSLWSPDGALLAQGRQLAIVIEQTSLGMDLHPRLSVNPQVAGYRAFEDELVLWAELGVRRVGLMSMTLAPYGWDRGLAAARDAGLDVPYLVHGIYTTVTDDEGWKSDVESLLACVDAAHEIGARCVYFCTGPPGKATWEDAVALFGERMQPVITAARASGIALAVENTLSLRTEISFIHSVRDAVIAARQIGIGICADTYACWVERGLRDTLRENVDLLHLVQISDFKVGTMVQPNRWVPGDGDLPIERIIRDVVDSGYGGVFDLELLGPAIEQEGGLSAVSRGVTWMNGALSEAGA